MSTSTPNPPAGSTTPSSPPPPNLSAFSGYFKRTIPDRQSLLLPYLPSYPSYTPTALPSLLHSSLPLSTANHMVENCIGLLTLPLAIAPSFLINSTPYLVPMATEEPSVVAAASGIGKLVAENGGFEAEGTGNVMVGQVQVLVEGGEGVEDVVRLIEGGKAELIREGNALCPSMVKRGGGVVDVSAERRESRAGKAASVVVFIKVDVCDSMGANVINTICEGISPSISALLSSHPHRIGLRILSNLCVDRRTTSTFRLPFTALSYKGVDGLTVAQRIIDAYDFACDDEFRAVTNNKGVMNGVDAVAIATGQDWRAIEAAAHAWAALRHRFNPSYPNTPYGPLATYHLTSTHLVGRLELPISVGTVGGALHSHPLYRFTHDLLHNPSAPQLAAILVSVGLAQNFAAIRALAVEGIQRGHMGLHAKNVAMAVGVEEGRVGEVGEWMVRVGRVGRKWGEVYWERRRGREGAVGSLWVEAEGVKVAGKDEKVEALVLFEGNGETLVLTKDAKAGAEEVMGRKWGQWVGEGLGEAATVEEAEEGVLKNVLRVVVSEGEGTSSEAGRRLVQGIVERLDAVGGKGSGARALSDAEGKQGAKL